MSIWYTEDLTGKWPVGAYAIVDAPNEQTARQRLEEAFQGTGVEPYKGYTLKKLKRGTAVVLSDGNY